MSDTREPQQEQASEPQAGERLASARRARDISLSEIAKELHLDEPKVLALEENRFDVLGAPVFAKGHLRKYADLVGVSIDDVLADYYRLNRSAGAPPVIGPKRRLQSDISLAPWIASAIVIAVAVAAAWWWFSLEQGSPTPAADPATGAQAVSPAAVSEPTVGDTVPGDAAAEEEADIESRASGTSNTEAIDDTAAVAAGQAAGPQTDHAESTPAVVSATAADREMSASAVIENPVRLRITFSGDCWTEVTDASGKRLFFDLGIAGRSVNLNGEAPLRVLLGNRDNVAVEVDGESYMIAAEDMRGNTALMTIDSQ